MWKYLPIALSLPLVSACSKPPVSVQMPPPPANLAQDCPAIPRLPQPLIDPDRAQWELDMIYAYAECAARHHAAIEAWQKIVQKTSG